MIDVVGGAGRGAGVLGGVHGEVLGERVEERIPVRPQGPWKKTSGGPAPFESTRMRTRFCQTEMRRALAPWPLRSLIAPPAAAGSRLARWRSFSGHQWLTQPSSSQTPRRHGSTSRAKRSMFCSVSSCGIEPIWRSTIRLPTRRLLDRLLP